MHGSHSAPGIVMRWDCDDPLSADCTKRTPYEGLVSIVHLVKRNSVKEIPSQVIRNQSVGNLLISGSDTKG